MKPVHLDVVETGMAVPRNLRVRWELIIGDARVELPKILARFPEIDIFLHDSEHTYGHMMFEFEAALPSLRSGGVLLSDDVELNKAFEEFCVKHELRYALLGRGVEESEVGVAIKP
jgi:hypothetical protein